MKKLLTLLFALIAMASMAFAEPEAELNYLCFEVKAGTTILLKKNGNANPISNTLFDKEVWTDFTELTVGNDCSKHIQWRNPQPHQQRI
jgi:hypothetical protein